MREGAPARAILVLDVLFLLVSLLGLVGVVVFVGLPNARTGLPGTRGASLLPLAAGSCCAPSFFLAFLDGLASGVTTLWFAQLR